MHLMNPKDERGYIRFANTIRQELINEKREKYLKQNIRTARYFFVSTLFYFSLTEAFPCKVAGGEDLFSQTKLALTMLTEKQNPKSIAPAQ